MRALKSRFKPARKSGNFVVKSLYSVRMFKMIAGAALLLAGAAGASTFAPQGFALTGVNRFVTPNNDGKIIRLAIPQLTEERRRDLVKRVHKRVEEAHIAIRNLRHHALDDLKEYEKEKLISEDEHRRGRDQLQEVTDKYIAQADEIGRSKEKEVMEI